MQIKTIQNPPLSQATLQVNVVSTLDNVNELEQFKKYLDDSFIQENNILSQDIKFEFSEGNAVVGERKINGYIFKNENIVIHVKLDSISISYVNKYYKSWDSFYPYCLSLINKFLEFSKIKTIIGCSLRYINKIDFKNDNLNLEEYFNTYPKYSEVFGNINSFYTQIKGFDKALNISKTQIMSDFIDQKNNLISIILDYDIVKIVNNKTVDFDTIYDELRTEKNNLFFSSITKKLIDKLNNDSHQNK